MKQSPVTTSRRSFAHRLMAAVAVLMAKPGSSVTAGTAPPFGMSETFCRTFEKLDAEGQALIVECAWLFTLARTPAPHPPRPSDLFTPPQLAANKRRAAADASAAGLPKSEAV